MRCSKELPSCRRCQNIASVCIYPPPPDRKLLAAQRAVRARLQRDIEGWQEIGGARSSSNPSPPDRGEQQQKVEESHSQRSLSSGSPVSTPPSVPISHQAQLPSDEVAMFLFDCFFNSMQAQTSMLFHRPTFLSEFQEGRLPEHVLLSVCAFGSV